MNKIQVQKQKRKNIVEKMTSRIQTMKKFHIKI